MRRFGPVWCLSAAFALGATLAALAAIVVDRGAIRVAAAASLVAGVLTIFAASRVPKTR
ncbi:MAG: hypothetical protein JWP97_4612 [Labilithrix sp.]|nr:hypothetical protein [Labilithrix sp.]